MVIMDNSFNKGVMYCLKLEPWSKTNYHGHGYLHNHVWLNTWISLADNLSIYSLFLLVTSPRSNQKTSTISNQHMAVSLIAHVCAKFNTSISSLFFCSCCTNASFRGYLSSMVCSTLVSNKSFFSLIYLVVLYAHLVQ